MRAWGQGLESVNCQGWGPDEASLSGPPEGSTLPGGVETAAHLRISWVAREAQASAPGCYGYRAGADVQRTCTTGKPRIKLQVVSSGTQVGQIQIPLRKS